MRLLRFAGDTVRFRGPDGTEFEKEGLRALFASLAPLLTNPLEQEIASSTCEGNRVSPEATSRTLLANGKVYSNIYAFNFEVENGEIVVSREYCDTTCVSAFTPD